jgi:hypothetical protein
MGDCIKTDYEATGCTKIEQIYQTEDRGHLISRDILGQKWDLVIRAINFSSQK